jgi:dTDP-4-dehydrorhamnose 3,5-epimerase-like enzyme
MKGRAPMESAEARPRLIEGGLHIDARGIVSHVNAFDFKGVDRFYFIRAHRPHEPRGWVGHRRDHKWFTAIQGTVLLAVVRPDSWDFPASNLSVERFVLSAAKPQVLCVPAGYATGSMGLTADAIQMIFSSGRFEDAKSDDYRFPVDTWPILPEK